MRNFYIFRGLLLLFLLTVSWGMKGQETVVESFKNLPTASNSSYSNRTWTGDDGKTWKATAARTDQKIGNNRAICWKVGSLTSPTYENGIKNLSFDYVKPFSNSGEIEIYINDNLIDAFDVTEKSPISYTKECNIAGSIVVKIKSLSNQVAVSNLQWTTMEGQTTLPKVELVFENIAPVFDISDATTFENRLTVTCEGISNIPVLYSSSNPDVASVDEKTGVVTAHKWGKTKIQATVAATEEYQGASASYDLTITAPTPEIIFDNSSVELDISTGEYKNTMTVKLEDKVNTELGVVYSSSNTAIATVDADGMVHFAKFGKVQIKATINPGDTYQGASASYDLTITAPTPVLTFEQAEIQVVGIGESVTNPLSVMLEEKPFTEGVVTYKSSSTSIATVDATTGVVTTKGAGSVTITAQIAAGTYYHAAEISYRLQVLKSPISLPFEFNGKRADIVKKDGLQENGLGTDYGSAPYLKFDTEGAYLLLSFDQNPGILSFAIIGNLFSGGIFSLEESANGSVFTVVREFTSIPGSTESHRIENLKRDTRYLRWVYTNKSKGNVGLGDIRLAKEILVEDPVIEPDQEAFGKSLDISLSCVTQDALIYYTLDGSEPTNESTQYSAPFTITESTLVKAVAYLGNEKSSVVEKYFECQPPMAYRVYFKELFDELNLTGGNDNRWSGNVSGEAISKDKFPEWEFGGKVYEANHCIRLSSGSEKGTLTMPSLDIEGDCILAFRANVWSGDGDNELLISTTSPVWSAKVKVKDALAFQTYSVLLPQLTAESRIKIEGNVRFRFFLDDIMVLQKADVSDIAGDVACMGVWTKEEVNNLLQTNSGLTSLDLSYLDLSQLSGLTRPSDSNVLLFSRQTHGMGANEIINATCSSLVLTDHKPFGTMAAFEAKAVSYSREAYQDGLWESLVLPYDVTELPADYEFVRFDGVGADGLSVSFRKAEALKAHVPYLMRYAGVDKNNGQQTCTFTASKAAITPQTATETYLGVYGRTETMGKYILTLHEGSVVFAKGDATSFVTPFHAYLDLEVPQSAPLRIAYLPSDVTGIGQAVADGWSVCSGEAGELVVRSGDAMALTVATADGRIVRRIAIEAGETRIAGLTAGIYVVNGKKGVVK